MRDKIKIPAKKSRGKGEFISNQRTEFSTVNAMSTDISSVKAANENLLRGRIS